MMSIQSQLSVRRSDRWVRRPCGRWVSRSGGNCRDDGGGWSSGMAAAAAWTPPYLPRWHTAAEVAAVTADAWCRRQQHCLASATTPPRPAIYRTWSQSRSQPWDRHRLQRCRPTRRSDSAWSQPEVEIWWSSSFQQRSVTWSGDSAAGAHSPTRW